MVVGLTDMREIERLLSSEGLDHLRVKKIGGSIVICSDDGTYEEKLARLTQLDRATWGLSFPHHTGRWEQVPFVGSMKELVTTLICDFSFHLEPW